MVLLLARRPHLANSTHPQLFITPKKGKSLLLKHVFSYYCYVYIDNNI